MENQFSLSDQFLKKIHQNINDNIDNEDFSVKALAQNIGMSRSMLHRKLIKTIGKSASDLIKETRLTQAKDLLEKDVATASEIAYLVGFKNPSYFNKVFKKHYKISPGDVRKGISIQEQDSLPLGKKKFSTNWNMTFILVAILIVMGLNLIGSLNNKVEKSIAVLPLHNLTGQAENNYFVDGIHDALIGELGQLSDVRVISRTSTLRYRESDMLLNNIADELNVNCIIEGSVFRVDDSIKILIQLIGLEPTERHLLVKEYKDDISNILNLHSLAVEDIAQKIDIKLSEKEKQHLITPRSVNPTTYKNYLRGMYNLNQGTPESFEAGIGFLRQAIKMDPNNPFAHAGLAIGYSILGHGQLNSDEAFQQAISSANEAIKLDPTITEAYTALALLNLYNKWEWIRTKKSFENALDNNPNNAIAHAHFAWYHILFEDMKKSIFHAKKAVSLEPHSASYASWLALLYYHDQNDKEAKIWAQKALDIKENIPYGNLVMGWICLRKKKYKQAIEYHQKLPVKNPYWQTLLAYAYEKAGQREKAMDLWHGFEKRSKKQSINACYRGLMAATLGYTDKAFELLNEACENKTYPITYINFYPCTEPIRDDPRYAELLKKMHLK